MINHPRKLFDAVRETIRLKHYSPRTKEAYVHWTEEQRRMPTALAVRARGEYSPG